MSSLINTNVMPFNSKAYQAKDEYGEFIDITDEDLKPLLSSTHTTLKAIESLKSLAWVKMRW